MENENKIFEEQNEEAVASSVEATEAPCEDAVDANEAVGSCAEAGAESEACAEGDVAAEEAVEEPAKPGKFKRLIKKWWFWVIVGVVITGLAIGVTAGIIAAVNNSSDDGYSGGSTYVSPYVTMVKTATNSSYGITYGAAFESFFTNTEWSYFKATSGEDVVEFEGDFLYSGSTARAKIQFIVDVSGGTMSVYHLSINGVDQSKLMLATLVNKVFESY